ncbi:unnamed protein product [Discosporangium mesarthrocarpum]
MSKCSKPVGGQLAGKFRAELQGTGFGGCLLHLIRLGSLSPLRIVQALDRPSSVLGEGASPLDPKAAREILKSVLDREYIIYRSYHLYKQLTEANKGIARVQGLGGSKSTRAGGVPSSLWESRDWLLLLIPEQVWVSLRLQQRDNAEHIYTPQRIMKAAPGAEVQDKLFMSIQANLAKDGRLHPQLAPRWAQALVKMMAIPSQALSLLVSMAEDLCLGGTSAADVVPSILDAFDIFDAPHGMAGAFPFSMPSPRTEAWAGSGTEAGTEEDIQAKEEARCRPGADTGLASQISQPLGEGGPPLGLGRDRGFMSVAEDDALINFLLRRCSG